MTWRSIRLAVATALVGLVNTDTTYAISGPHSFTFSQRGYSQGATVTGAFAGNDLDGNGILVHFPGQAAPPVNTSELTQFSMQFSGNSLAPAFNLTLADLYGFVFQLGTHGIGDDPATDPNFGDLNEGIGVIGANHFYTSGNGPTGMIGGFVGGDIDFDDLVNIAAHALDSSPNLVLVAPVPEPTTLAMLLAVTIAGLARRRPC